MWTVTFWHSLKPYTCEHIASQKVMLEQHMNSNEVHVFSRVIRAAAQICPCSQWQNSTVIPGLSKSEQLLAKLFHSIVGALNILL